MDISTAPKDNTSILVYYEHGSIELVRWDGKFWEQVCDATLKVTSRGIIGWMPVPELKNVDDGTPFLTKEKKNDKI